MSPELVASERAPGLHIAPGAEIPDDVDIAPHVTIYAGVELGSRVSLQQGAILGRPQQIDPRSRSPRRPPHEPTVIGDGCRIGSGTVVVAGVRIGPNSYVGDQVLLRETAMVAEEVMIGRGCTVARDTTVGPRTRVQNDTLIGVFTRIEADALISPRVIFVGDPTMGRQSPVQPATWTLVRRACRIGAGAIIFAGVEVGEEGVVGAGSIVREDVPARTVVVGVPARTVRAVTDEELLEHWRGDG